MYGEYCVTKSFTNADDIRLRINSLLVYTTDGSHNREKEGLETTIMNCSCLSITEHLLLKVSDLNQHFQ